jgi:hypothetical protein
MIWGTGPALGLLAFIGYLLGMAGAVLAWRNREDFSIWVQDEISIFRRNFSRYTPVGPFYCRREESRFNALPASFLHSLKRFPHSRVNGAAVLLLVGVLLFFLDFYI